MHMSLKLIIGFYFLYASTNTHVMTMIRVLMTLNSLWTFDPLYFLSPPLCISQHIHEVYIPFLETMAALYSFTLLLLTYILIELYARDCKLIVIMWKLIHPKCNCLLGSWNSDKSLIQVFATLFLLSFIKFMGVVNSTLMVSNVFNMKNQVVTEVPFIDPTVTSFSSTYFSLNYHSVSCHTCLLHTTSSTCTAVISHYLLHEGQHISETKVGSWTEDIYRHILWQL